MTRRAQTGVRYQLLADQLERQIRAGVYGAGDRLPSVRTLHRERGLAIMTVNAALAELERRGHAQARARSGYFVTSALDLAIPAARRPSPRPRRMPASHPVDDFVAATVDPRLVQLGGAVLGSELLPLTLLGRIARETLPATARVFASYDTPAGAVELRRALARRGTAIGHELHADDVVITSGCMDAIRLALLASTRVGDTVAIETPTFFGVLQAIRELGLSAIEIQTDPSSGLDPDALDTAARRHPIRSLVVTPTLHNPTGACMSVDRRRRLLAVARRHRISIIEDDVYGELVVTGRVPTLAAMDPTADVLLCSSFSKTLAPALRIGWIVPRLHLDRVRRLKLSGTIASPPFGQLVCAEMLARGAFDRHVRRLRSRLASQVAQARRAIANHFPPGTQVTDPVGGFLLWVRLPPRADAVALQAAALDAGISILPGTLCAIGNEYRGYIRISCGQPWDRRSERAFARLGQLVSTACAGDARDR